MLARITNFPAAGPRRLVGIVLGTVTAVVSIPALAAEVSSGNNDVSLTLSGQVNRALLWADDGSSSRVHHVDNSNSSTRFLLQGNGTLNQDIGVGAQIEAEIESNPSSDIAIDGGGVGGGATFAERKLEVYFDHRRFGKLWLGQGDTASNGVSEVDLSGTAVVTYSSVADMAGGIGFVGTGATISDAYSNMDGLSRDDRIRYDSPSLGGFVVSASNADSAKYDVAARYSGTSAGGLTIAAAAGYAVDKNDSAIDSQISGSVSVLLGGGLNVTAALGIQDIENSARDPVFLYAKIGYIQGANAFSIDFAQAEEITAANADFTAIGFAYVRDFANAGTEVYVGARLHSLDVPGNPDDIAALLAGARVKF